MRIHVPYHHSRSYYLNLGRVVLLWFQNLNVILSSCQGHKDVLSTLLDHSISLDPLIASIQGLALAAKEAEDEARVRCEEN